MSKFISSLFAVLAVVFGLVAVVAVVAPQFVTVAPVLGFCEIAGFAVTTFVAVCHVTTAFVTGLDIAGMAVMVAVVLAYLSDTGVWSFRSIYVTVTGYAINGIMLSDDEFVWASIALVTTVSSKSKLEIEGIVRGCKLNSNDETTIKLAADSHKWNRNSNIFDAPSADDSVELMVVAAIATISNFNDFTIELVKLTGWSRTEAYVRQMHATVCREMRLIRKLAAITGISVDINRYIALMGARSVLDGMFVVEVAVVCDAVVTDAVVA